jgi:nucleotide-binding universal stress UspA family protein
MFQNILVPVDLSAKNKQTLEIAVKVASLENGKVTPLHVIELIADTSFEEFGDFYTKLEQKAQEEMEKMVAPYVESGVKIERIIVFGNRTEEISKFAESQAVDLMVMNAHKVNPSDPAQGWGTLSYKVGILAQCPVLLVK